MELIEGQSIGRETEPQECRAATVREDNEVFTCVI
jgi:hypothetical protein